MPDSEQDVFAAVREFLLVIDPSSAPTQSGLARLRFSLDRLAYLQHLVEKKSDPPDYPDPPAQNYLVLRKTIADQFPGLGCYSLPHPITRRIGKDELEVADSVDDLAVIASELHSFVWRAEHTTLDDALWHFRNGFAMHWGEHLRGLQLYLHRLQ